MLSDLRESGFFSIEQDATWVCLFIARSSYDRGKRRLKGKQRSIIAKRRKRADRQFRWRIWR